MCTKCEFSGVKISTHKSTAGANGCPSFNRGIFPDFSQKVALGGRRRVEPGPTQATVPPLCHKALAKQAGVEAEVKVQAVAAMP